MFECAHRLHIHKSRGPFFIYAKHTLSGKCRPLRLPHRPNFIAAKIRRAALSCCDSLARRECVCARSQIVQDRRSQTNAYLNQRDNYISNRLSVRRADEVILSHTFGVCDIMNPPPPLHSHRHHAQTHICSAVTQPHKWSPHIQYSELDARKESKQTRGNNENRRKYTCVEALNFISLFTGCFRHRDRDISHTATHSREDEPKKPSQKKKKHSLSMHKYVCFPSIWNSVCCCLSRFSARSRIRPTKWNE